MDFLSVGIALLAITIIVMASFYSMGLMLRKLEISQVARKYILVMVTRGDRTEEERQQLLEGMELTRIQLNQAYAEFNAHSDPDLVDSCVFNINALRSRYSYYVRQVKQLDAQKEEAG